jgi:uncharacterized protein YjbI with pentapeptide repeats
MGTSKKQRDPGQFAIIAPDVAPIDTARRILAAELLADSALEEVLLDRIDLQGSRGTNITFRGARFCGVRGTDSRFENLRLLDAVHESCDWSNAAWDGAKVARCVFTECKMTGFGAANARFENTCFIRCKIDLAIFHRTEFEACSFENCLLRDSSFEEAILSKVRFGGSDLANVRMARAQLEDVDLRGCEVRGLQFDLRNARGLTIDPAQAPDLIRLLGVRVQGVS